MSNFTKLQQSHYNTSPRVNYRKRGWRVIMLSSLFRLPQRFPIRTFLFAFLGLETCLNEKRVENLFQAHLRERLLKKQTQQSYSSKDLLYHFVVPQQYQERHGTYAFLLYVPEIFVSRASELRSHRHHPPFPIFFGSLIIQETRGRCALIRCLRKYFQQALTCLVRMLTHMSFW